MNFIPPATPSKIGFDSIKELIGKQLYTPAGHLLLESMEPSADPKTVTRLRNETSDLMALQQNEQLLPLRQLNQIEDLLSDANAEGSLLEITAFTDIRAHAQSARILHSFLEKYRETTPSLWKVGSGLQTMKLLEESINKVVDEDGEMRNDASSELKSIRSKLNRQKQSLRNTIQKIFKSATAEGIASDEGPTLRSGRMVIPIQAEYKRKMDGFIHDVSASGQTVYLEPAEALHINNDIRQLESEEKREIERILRSLTTTVRKNIESLRNNSEIIGRLDLIHARTRSAEKWKGVLPELSVDNRIKIFRGKNPNLLLKNLGLPKEQRDPVVPLDLEFESSEKGLIISGPNAGGKSVALKTIGILICMHQCGIPLPVSPDSTLPVISGIYLDMGDEQSIENDLSTFSSRLQWMRNTLDKLDSRALVLIDEAGTGTDPEEGGALFQAFIESVLESDSRIIATTHHGALKVFAHDHPNIANGAMEFDQETLSPTYRLRKGIPGSSYAFEIAGRMNIPESLLKRSRSLLGEQRDRMADLLLSLEKRLQEAEDAQAKYEKLRKEAEDREQNYRKKSKELDQQRKQKLDEAYREADSIMMQANQKIEQAVEKIVKQGREDHEKIRKARREIADHKKEIRKKLEESRKHEESAPTDENGEPEVGDMVRLKESETKGELVEKEGNDAVVLAGGLRIKTKYNKLVKTSGKPDKSKNKTEKWRAESYRKSLTKKNVGPSLNIRGYRGDEAIKEVMHYLDNAIAAGLSKVDIVHGKGEGILKKLVHEYLDQRKDVKKYELAPIERGGAGCTVVTLE